MIYSSNYLPDVIRFLEMLGFEFSLDWDDELEISYPDHLEACRVAMTAKEFTPAIVQRLRIRRANDMHHCVGGPFNGHRHEFYYWSTLDGTPLQQFRGINVSRAKWAVYELSKDGRAFFRGFTTSEKKAREGKFEKAEA